MRISLRLLVAGAAVLAAACTEAQPTAPGDESLTAVDAAPGSVVAGEYIVVFRDDVRDAPGLSRALAQQHRGTVRFTYQHAIKGFAAALPEPAVDALRRNPNVAYVEANRVVTKHAVTQQNATWGIDRIDQLDLPLSGTYTYTPDGTGVTAYIIDTGILLSHNEFGGRAVSGYDAVDGGSADDCDGHGTHVAGTVGGTTYGVAKNVRLVAVRVLNCSGSGTWAGVIAGVDWVTGNAVKPAVANMSLGGGAVQSLDDAVSASITSGVFYALSAGNGNMGGKPIDACGQSPARTPAAMTVGATTSSDTESSFSNYGTCVDILAPGSSIRSAYIGSNSASATASGTSMASPHVAGAAALYLDLHNGGTPAEVTSALKSAATPNTITLHRSSATGGTPNLLLYTGFMNGTTPDPDPEPEPGAFSLSATGYKVRGVQTADLSWAGAAGTSVDVFRDGAKVTTTLNDGAYTNNIGAKGGGSYVYKVCEAGTATCSNQVTVTF